MFIYCQAQHRLVSKISSIKAAVDPPEKWRKITGQVTTLEMIAEQAKQVIMGIPKKKLFPKTSRHLEK